MDDLSTHPVLWLEVGLSDEPDRNKVYGISNTIIEDMRMGRSVLTIGSSQ
jgi:hypothetical protein